MNATSNHPLDIWQSKKVTDLLLDFFIANFLQAQIPKDFAEKLIFTAWSGRENSDRESLRKECDLIFRLAKKHHCHKINEPLPVSFLNLDKIDCFLDLGANKLTTVNYLAQKYLDIKKFIAIDIVPQGKKFFDESRSIYYQSGLDDLDILVPDNSVDFINIQFVLHHFDNLDAIYKSLKFCKRVLKKDGSILLWEESFTKNMEIDKIEEVMKLGIKTDFELTKKFYDLSNDERIEFIIVNDWLVNVSNAHMPWTKQYYDWNGWQEIFKSAGFKLVKDYCFGLRVNGLLKQGVHMQGYFKIDL